jgi:hypothetical protein
VVLDRLGGLAELVASITKLPEAVWHDRLTAYRAQVELYGGYFLGLSGTTYRERFARTARQLKAMA